MSSLNPMWYLWILFLILSCSGPTNTAGGAGVETDTGFSGVVTDGENPVGGALVVLYPKDFNPVTDQIPDSLKDITDSQGEYHLKVSAPGIYNIEVYHPEKKTTALIQSVIYPTGKLDTLIRVSQGVLKAPGELVVSLEELPGENPSFIYIPGTSIFAEINSNAVSSGILPLISIAPAEYKSLHFMETHVDSVINIIDVNVEIKTGESNVLGPYYAWEDTAKVFFNTTSAGVEITNNVIEFPVLVRLEQSNSSFNSSKLKGKDIRFTKSDGKTSLGFEIENWDTINLTAEIWVRVDTLFGNNESQYLYLFSNNKNSVLNAGTNVFANRNGFTGVWHLSDGVNTNSSGYKDATTNDNHGTGVNLIDNQESSGIVAKAQTFQGNNDFILISDAPEFTLTQYTLSAWIQLDSLTGVQNIIGQWGNFGPGNGSWRINVSENRYLSIWNHDGNISSWLVDTTMQLDLNTWYHVAGVYKGDTSGLNGILYVNGREIFSGTLNRTPHNSNLFVGIGALAHMGTNEFFNGTIDEVRISHEVRSDDWIKLCFENQKTGSTLLKIE